MCGLKSRGWLPKDRAATAGRMAKLAQLIRDIIRRAVGEEAETGSLHQQMEAFREVLLHDLTEDQFADMYARTICYGLFAARCNAKGSEHFTREHAAYDLPKTNPFLRKMFNHIAGPELDERIAWAVDDLAELLHRSDVSAILEDFGKSTRREDPVVHFYETFLAAYDPKMREARGVYYTPEPVVSYIVRSVDHILKADFKMGKHFPPITTYPIAGANEVDKVRYNAPGEGGSDVGRVWINHDQYFEGVPPELWNFHVGGYQVLQKWLKDRKGRKLTYDDLTHYQRIVSTLAQTLRLMSEIECRIEAHGGWPMS
jgi:hypothetical protein